MASGGAPSASRYFGTNRFQRFSPSESSREAAEMATTLGSSRVPTAMAGLTLA
jgi:hypothetical protein